MAADGYTEELQEIDSLVGVAQQEAERKLSIVENCKPVSSDAASREGKTVGKGTIDEAG